MVKKKVSARKWVTVNVDHLSPYDLDSSAVSIKDRMNKLIEEHGENVYLDFDSNHHEPYDHSPSPRFNVMVGREENDEEFAHRIDTERIQKEAQDARDLAEFNRLKLKIEGKK